MEVHGLNNRIMQILRNRKHLPCLHTVIATEREIEVGTRAHRASVSMQFRVIRTSTRVSTTIWEHGGKCFLFLL